jgi:hypothetical protein
MLRQPKKCSFKTTVTQIVTTVRGMEITPLLRYPYHYNLAQQSPPPAAHCRQSTNFSNGPRIWKYFYQYRTVVQIKKTEVMSLHTGPISNGSVQTAVKRIMVLLY